MTKLANRIYAVAVRDGADLFLILRIRRSQNGDIYTMIPTGRNNDEWKKWNPHASYHADGQYHHKSFDRKMLQRQEQVPDTGFTGTINLMTRPIAANEPRAFGVLCKTAEFSEVFEIPVFEVTSDKYRTHISVDLVEPGGKEIVTPRAKVLRQAVFKDAIPWILVTLFENPRKPESPP